MNLSRLMVLGLLASEGPMHGHRIRRVAEQTSVESWGGINVGALYRELHRMESDGLVEAVRSEQVGRRPARTVYRITEEGERVLPTLRAEAFRDESGYLDSVGVALLFGGATDRRELADLLAFRRQLLEANLEALGAERHRFTPGLDLAAIAVYRRGELRLAAELSWHEEMERLLIEDPDAAGPSTPGNAAIPTDSDTTPS